MLTSINICNIFRYIRKYIDITNQLDIHGYRIEMLYLLDFILTLFVSEKEYLDMNGDSCDSLSPECMK